MKDKAFTLYEAVGALEVVNHWYPSNYKRLNVFLDYGPENG